MSKKDQAYTGTMLVGLSSFFYGTYGIWTRLLGPNVGAFWQSALRGLMIAALLLPYLVVKKQLQWPKWRTEGVWLAILAAGSIFSAPANFVAINSLGGGLAILTIYTVYLLLMVIWGVVYDKNKLTKERCFEVAVALIGLILIFNPLSSTHSLTGILAALASGLAIALTVIPVKYITGSAFYVMCMSWAVTFVVCLIPALVIHEQPGELFRADKLGLVFVFALISIAASVSVTAGVRLISAAVTGLIGLLENVFAILFGLLLFHEHFGRGAIIGSLLILCAAALPNLSSMIYRKGASSVTE